MFKFFYDFSSLENTIDFGTNHEINFISDIQNFTRKNLAINDYEKFKQSIQDATMEDANYIGLIDLVQIIEASGTLVID